MKKVFALLLTLILLFTGCGQEEAPGESSSAAQETVSGSSQTQRPQVDTDNLPKSPEATQDALALPEVLATSEEGYEVIALTPAQYDMECPLNRGGFRGFLQMDYFQAKQDGKVAIFSPEGELLSDYIYDDNEDGWGARYGYITLKKEGKYGVVDLDGNQVVPFEYEYAWPANEDGTLFEVTKQDKNYLVNDQGEQVLELGDRGSGYEFDELDGTYASLKNGVLQFYDKDLKPIKNVACDEVRVSYTKKDRVVYSTGGKFGILDSYGETILVPVYDDIDYFSGDYAVFTQNNKKGILDSNGEVAFDAQWDDIYYYGPFTAEDGQEQTPSASFMKGDQWGVATDLSSGQLLVEPKYDFIGRFGRYYASIEEGGKFGAIDRQGNVVLEPVYDTAVESADTNLEEGYLTIEGTDGPFSAGIIDTAGNMILPTDNYIVFASQQNDYNLVLTPDEKWGYIDNKGQFVIQPKFEDADRFAGDTAIVKLNGKICLIDRDGEIVLSTVFTDVTAYNPETMVFAAQYTDPEGRSKYCLAKFVMPVMDKY